MTTSTLSPFTPRATPIRARTVPIPAGRKAAQARRARARAPPARAPPVRAPPVRVPPARARARVPAVRVPEARRQLALGRPTGLEAVWLRLSPPGPPARLRRRPTARPPPWVPPRRPRSEPPAPRRDDDRGGGPHAAGGDARGRRSKSPVPPPPPSSRLPPTPQPASPGQQPSRLARRSPARRLARWFRRGFRAASGQRRPRPARRPMAYRACACAVAAWPASAGAAERGGGRAPPRPCAPVARPGGT